MPHQLEAQAPSLLRLVMDNTLFGWAMDEAGHIGFSVNCLFERNCHRLTFRLEPYTHTCHGSADLKKIIL